MIKIFAIVANIIDCLLYASILSSILISSFIPIREPYFIDIKNWGIERR